jgi:chaperonin GroEL (HSP60 family)
VELANLQDSEVGDGTTSVVIIAAELLKRSNELVKNNIHPTTIIAGYRLAMREAIKYIQSNLSIKVDSLERDTLLSIARTSLSSKFCGGSDSEHFSKMVVDAILSVKVTGRRKSEVSSRQHQHPQVSWAEHVAVGAVGWRLRLEAFTRFSRDAVDHQKRQDCTH